VRERRSPAWGVALIFEVDVIACGDAAARGVVRKTPSWPRTWANFNLLQLYSKYSLREYMGRLASFGPT